jgi:hypothetical protein
MEPQVIVLIVMLAMPNGEQSINIKPMSSASSCEVQARIEASDPFVADVQCSKLEDGKLHLDFRSALKSRRPNAAVRSLG